jgi:hypothetical protein
MKVFMSSTEFITGAFVSFMITMTILTFIFGHFFTSNELLKHSGFYKDGKIFKVVESSKLRENCRGYDGF